MAVATDATLMLLANNVNGIDTSGLMTDATGQDIVSAINDISSAISPAASNVTYQNTASELSATNVQSAIDEVASEKQDNLYGGTLTAPDFNAITNYGMYWIASVANSQNAPPTTGYGILEVMRNRKDTINIVMQRFTKYASSGSEMARTWVRYYANTQWYSWIQIY